MATDWPTHFLPDAVKQGYGGGKLSTYTIALEAWRRGLNVTFTDSRLRRYLLSDGLSTISMNDSRPTSLAKAKEYRNLYRKWDTKRRLEAAGVPAPRGVLLDTETTTKNDLSNHAEDLGYPLVLKPNSGSVGKGVLTNIRSRDQLFEGYRHLIEALGVRSVLMEQHYEGDDYRVLVIGDKAVAACQRVPANVKGNGESTVLELIEAKNEVRRQNPFLSGGLIKIDYEVERRLRSQGLTLSDIPEPDRHIPLRWIANASAGGDVIDVTDSLPDAILKAAVKAVVAMPGIVIAGVDILYRTGYTATPETYTVLEMNSRPHIGVNMYPTEGVGRDVPKAYLDYLFPTHPRPSEVNDEVLVFDLTQVIPPLRSGVAASVALAPLPEHRYPIRVQFTYDDPHRSSYVPLSARNRAQRLARKFSVGGRFYRENDNVHLIVGAGTREAVDRIRSEVEGSLDASVVATRQQERWPGLLNAGFRISPRLVRRRADP